MQYSAILLALAGLAYAQLPGVPACATPVLQPALTACASDPNGLIACLCASASEFQAPIQAACSCSDVNTALTAAKGFCSNLTFAPLDCSATSSSSAAALSTPTPSTLPGTSASAVSPTVLPTTSTTASVSSTVTSVLVSGTPQPTHNGTVTSAAPPAATSVAVGAGSVVKAGGFAVVGAVLAALAL